RFRSEPRLTLICGDFLDTWENAVRDHGRPSKILGNLPYSSASQMVAQILESGIQPQRLLVTVQRELGDRMASPPSTKSYSAFSVLCQACCEVIVRGELNPGSFYPPPNVVSAIVELRPRQDAPSGPALGLLTRITRALFASRRKTLRNNIGRAGLDTGRLLEALDVLGIDGGARAEELSPGDYVRLAERLAGTPTGSAGL
ncbi:MAG TPA: rRNA adenine dimethyltransferase family protein, partial [Spirochaetia bacterium]|nr:rRNA adenine dimethyltransferase family protein [Spirochaetia bacterium]